MLMQATLFDSDQGRWFGTPTGKKGSAVRTRLPFLLNDYWLTPSRKLPPIQQAAAFFRAPARTDGLGRDVSPFVVDPQHVQGVAFYHVKDPKRETVE